MATKTLVIDGTDRDHFFLSVESGTLRVGDAASHPEGVVRDMRILRIRCEVEVEEDREVVPVDEPGVLAPSSLRAGEAVKLAHAELTFAGDTALDLPTLAEAPLFKAEPAGDLQLDLDLSNSTDGAAPAETDSPTTVAARRFKVIDGGDQGRSFKLPEEGTITLGRVGHADIGLNDFFVSKVHCLVHIDGYKIMVSHVEGQAGTLIDGMKISVSQKLRTNSVLRIGNSHLKLEQGPFAEEPEPIAPPKPPKPEPPPPPPKKVVRAQVIKDPLGDLEGKDFGHFKMKRMLGRGFAGAAFEAEDTKKNQIATVKVLSNEFPSNAAELNRFVSEFKVAQSVRHANLVALQGAGKVGAFCWFAREFIEGESAADVIQRAKDGSKPSWTRAARTIVHLARALEELQKHKLVHGNIVPNNVLLAKESQQVKLADLRLVQALTGSKSHAAFVEKKRVAEAGYAAPESSMADAISEMYSIGAVAYAMIAGKPPEGTKPPKPSSIYKKVPTEFDRVVMKLLAHQPDHRYQSTDELLAELKPICETNELKV